MFGSRIARERQTIKAMIRLYCRDLHGKGSELCPTCVELNEYSDQRLDECPFWEDKPTCNKCPVHCYNSDMRQKVKDVMRYAGPRMMRRHPVLAIMHLMDGLRKK